MLRSPEAGITRDPGLAQFLPHNRCVFLELNCLGPAMPWTLGQITAFWTSGSSSIRGRTWGAGHHELSLLCKNQCIFSIFQDMTFFGRCYLPLTIDLSVYLWNDGTSCNPGFSEPRTLFSHPLLVGNWVLERQVLGLKRRVQVAARFAIVSSSVP